MSSLGPGSIIAGRYRMVDLLGRGAMGEVWRAEHTSLGTPVAIKLIDIELLGSEHNKTELVQRFFREAKAAAALRSPHVVQIHDHGYEGPLPYIAMELLEGETLEQRIERDRVLPPMFVAEIITHVARAMLKAHEAGIVHRDLKPSNVFLVKNDDEEVGKVLDFGIAKATHSGVLGSSGGVSTRTGSVVGTPCYMSPEQALGNKTIDHRADLWAIGVIAYESLCGRRPFDSDALGDLIVQICARPLPVPSSVAPVPEGFDAWFAKACARDPNERFQSAKELAESLRWILAPDTTAIRRMSMSSLPNIAAPPPRPSQPDPSALAKTDPTTMTHRGLVSAVTAAQPSPKRVRPAVIAFAAAAALLVGGAVVVMLSRTGGPPASEPPAQASQPAATTPPPPEPVQSAAPTTDTVVGTVPPPEPVAPPEPTASAAPPQPTSKATSKATTTKAQTGTTKTKSGSTTTTKTKKDQLGF
ncbi:serine/threonine-protein kinase [Polyangium aurulentum]|uniref:serine/threonine-protein kinase n=1 Tax=Polyangium aurulentum TaxID=2567896 RepID=UPI0010AE13C1|nr:serine/threonine-protein kinase [Polyangium aurulentum]UQA57343.1 serine/threonine protein kinase [Polyangium aurulentum]